MRVLAIGDLHIPANHQSYLSFCLDMKKKWKCNKVVFLGDIFDHHAISFHPKEPHLPSSGGEFIQAFCEVQKWYEAFPKADVCIGNHDERPTRAAKSVGMSHLYLKAYSDTWETPKWNWKYESIIDNVLYTHSGSGGKTPALMTAVSKGISTVLGHHHSKAGIHWTAQETDRKFGMDVGCGVDRSSLQMAYGKHLKEKPVLSVGIVIDGTPYHEVMPCNKGEKYEKTRDDKVQD